MYMWRQHGVHIQGCVRCLTPYTQHSWLSLRAILKGHSLWNWHTCTDIRDICIHIYERCICICDDTVVRICNVAFDASHGALLIELVGHTEKVFYVKLVYMYRYMRYIHRHIWEMYMYMWQQRSELVGHSEQAFNVNLAYMCRYMRDIYIHKWDIYMHVWRYSSAHLQRCVWCLMRCSLDWACRDVYVYVTIH